MKRAKTKVPATIDAYIAAFPDDVQAKLTKIHAVVAKSAPQAEQSISHGIAAFKLNGPLLYFAAFKAHIGLYPITTSVKAAFQKELAGYAQSKGTIRFPLYQPVPYALIGKIARFRVKENGDAATSKGSPAISTWKQKIANTRKPRT
jgi:uncharacterized protein YdhG (YjbR/CyaY superfamily)